MSDKEVTLENEIPGGDERIIGVPGIIGVKIVNQFETGLLFGLGFCLAVVLYGLIIGFIVKAIIEEGLRL